MMVRRGVEARECERVAFAHLESVAVVQIPAATQKVSASEMPQTGTEVRFDVSIWNELQSITAASDPLGQLKMTMEHQNDRVKLVIARKY